MERILYNTNANEYRAFLTGTVNFRKTIYPEYKANRVQPKPIHLAACKEHLVNEWKAETATGIEADDLIGIAVSESISESVVCSIDKDLRQIPGQHFNFVKLDWTEVDEYQAAFNFYRQFLEGDRSDNIFGIDGIGPKKAEKQLYGLTPEEMFDRVRELYNDDKRMLTNGRCLYILREKYNIWQPPQLIGANDTQLEEVTKLFSILGISTGLPEPIKQKSEDGFPIVGTQMEPTMEMAQTVP